MKKNKKVKIQNTVQSRWTEYINIAMLCLAALAVLFVSWTFTGKWPWIAQPYNSYMLQAQSWLQGRLDLGKNYPHLELAIYQDKYFVSFPPFPSYLMLPFAALKWYNADGMIAVISALAAPFYAYRIMRHYNVSETRSMLFSLLLTVGSNWLFTAQSAWVWFIAQNLAFTLSLMAIYYAIKGKLGLSLAFWACAVGCRPLQGLYLPVLLYLFYTDHKTKAPADRVVDIIKKNVVKLIPMAVIALSYMLLNFARFGNPLEFGHNFLPEFTRTTTGQFNTAYMQENLKHIWRLPDISFSGTWEYQKFDGWCFYIVSPIVISYIVYSVYGVIKKKISPSLAIIVFTMLLAELILTTAHKTMGGSHFGNRYTNDVLPLAFLGIAATMPEGKPWEKFNYILLFWGAALNIIGSVLFYV